VFQDGGILSRAADQPLVGCDALMRFFQKYLDDMFGQSRFNCIVDIMRRHGVEHLVYFYMVVELDCGL